MMMRTGKQERERGPIEAFGHMVRTARRMQVGLAQAEKSRRVRFRSAREIDVWVSDKIDTAMACRVIDTIRNNPCAERVCVHIDSPGGNIRAGWMICAELVALGRRTHAYAHRLCHSMALDVLLSCRERVAHRDCSFLHHSPIDGRGNKASARSHDAAISVTNYLAARCKVDPDIVAGLKDSGDVDVNFNAREAHVAGIATAVEVFTPFRSPEARAAERAVKTRRARMSSVPTPVMPRMRTGTGLLAIGDYC